MPRLEALQLVKEFLFPGRHQGTSIPPLDGGLTPNDGLDGLPSVHDGLVDEPDDLLLDGDGLYVTSGSTLLRLSEGDRTVVASFDGEAGALAHAADGRLLVCVAGVGVVAVDGDRTTVLVETGCPTDLAVASDGTVYVTDGSTEHHGQDWVRDLMARNAAGRLLKHDPRTGRTTVLAKNLAYASGVSLTEDDGALVVCEAWAHRISRFALTGNRDAVLRDNFPGYPGRISLAADGGYWLAVFALRTQLVEFVLTQRDYVEEMMRTIEPDYWIRPALRGLNNGLEPLQGGQIRKLGVIKPWAPPRSYGLVTRMDAEGYPRSSWHSRGGGHRHGVTSARQFGDRVLVAVRGGDRILEVKLP